MMYLRICKNCGVSFNSEICIGLFMINVLVFIAICIGFIDFCIALSYLD